MTRNTKRQLIPVGLIILTLPVWWMSFPPINPNRSDAGAALADLQGELHGEALNRIRAVRDIKFRTPAYANLVIRACNEPEAQWAQWDRHEILPTALIRQLTGEWAHANVKLKETIAENVFSDTRHASDYGPLLAQMLQDKDPAFRERARTALIGMEGPVPQEITALTQSGDKELRDRVVEALSLRDRYRLLAEHPDKAEQLKPAPGGAKPKSR